MNKLIDSQKTSDSQKPKKGLYVICAIAVTVVIVFAIFGLPYLLAPHPSETELYMEAGDTETSIEK